MTTTVDVLNVTWSDQTSPYSSGPLDVSACFELNYCAAISAMTENTLLVISVVDLNGNLIQIYGSNLDVVALPIQDTADIGPSWGYQVNRTFGKHIQVDITSTGTWTGNISIIGKG